jgi:acyl-CoA reductase-like NAD-dependent aldehyde dehydrogenase
MKYPTKMLIKGSLVDGDRALEVKNPATGKTSVTVACGSERQADEALQAAKAVQPAWEALGWSKRKAMLLAVADAMEARADAAAELVVYENGKQPAKARSRCATRRSESSGWAGQNLSRSWNLNQRNSRQAHKARFDRARSAPAPRTLSG